MFEGGECTPAYSRQPPAPINVVVKTENRAASCALSSFVRQAPGVRVPKQKGHGLVTSQHASSVEPDPCYETPQGVIMKRD